MRIKFILPLLIAAILVIGSVEMSANAQAPKEGWTTPVNLSNSGAAENPAATIDSEGVIHVLWKDEFAGLQYTRFKNNQWSTPRHIDLDYFRFAVPYIISTKSGYVHAFWISDKGDLLYTRVVAKFMNDPDSWYSVTKLDSGVVKFDVNLDDAGNMNLAYVRTSDEGSASAGIYYRLTRNEGASWLKAKAVFMSSYIRSIASDTANIQITNSSIGDSHLVFISWDMPFLRQIYLARSIDGGVSFENPIVVGQPDPVTNTINPRKIHVASFKDQVMLVWQDGDPKSNCLNYYQVSSDSGNTWGERQTVLNNFATCPRELSFLPVINNQVLLQAIFQDQVYFLAWDGARWSGAQPQPFLSKFEDPSTLIEVKLDCQQFFKGENDLLYAVGCDSARVGDIWMSSRTLMNTSDWFLPPSDWTPPREIMTGTLSIKDLAMITDAQNRVHIFWSLKEQDKGPQAPETIDYARLDGDNWSEPSDVLKTNAGKADQPALAIDPNSRLFVCWRGGESGEMLLNWVDAATAYATSRWSDPIIIPSPHPLTSNPNIIVDDKGTIFVAYLIPFNEDRGVYLIKSEDGGLTWGAPVPVFNAASAGWDMVDQLHMTKTGDGDIYLLWTRSTTPEGVGARALYYSKSIDGGMTWNEPSPVTDQPIAWSQIVGVGEQTVHIVWQEVQHGEYVINHSYSLDGGITWNRSGNLVGQEVVPGGVYLLVDKIGQVRLIRIVKDRDSNELALQGFLWGGEQWDMQDNVGLGWNINTQIVGLVATITQDGRLSVLYTANYIDQLVGLQYQALNYMDRRVDLPLDFATPTSVPTNTPQPTPLPEGTPTPLPSPTPQLSQPTTPGTGGDNGLLSSGLIIGVGLALVIVVLATGAEFVRKRNM